MVASVFADSRKGKSKILQTCIVEFNQISDVKTHFLELIELIEVLLKF